MPNGPPGKQEFDSEHQTQLHDDVQSPQLALVLQSSADNTDTIKRQKRA
jgi:hypothetical protein